MKSIYLSIFFLCIASVLFAADGNYIVLRVASNYSCPAGDSVPPSSIPVGCSVTTISRYLCMDVFHVTCTDGIPGFEGGMYQEVVVAGGVNVGSEYTAVDAQFKLFTQYLETNGESACSTGYHSTGWLAAPVAKIESSTDPTISNLTIDMYARTLCEKNGVTGGNVLPTPNLGGGSGGTAATVDLAPTNSILTSINNTLAEINVKPAGSGTGTATDMTTTNNILNSILNKTVSVDMSLTNNLLSYGFIGKDGLTLGDRLNSTNSLLTSINAKPAPVATDMTATDNLLTTANTTLTAINNKSSSGSTDMTTTNGLLTDSKGFLSGISNALTGTSTLAAVPAPAPRTTYKNTSIDTDLFMAGDYKTAFMSFQSSAQNTAVFKLVNGFFGGVPHDGSSVISFNGGVFGSHTFDFASWATFMAVLKGIILVMFSAASVRIVILKG